MSLLENFKVEGGLPSSLNNSKDAADMWLKFIKLLVREAVSGKKWYPREEYRETFYAMLGDVIENSDKTFPLDRLIGSGVMSVPEIIALLLAAAADRDGDVAGDMEKINGFDMMPAYASAMILCDLFCDGNEGDIRTLLDPDNFLNRFLIRRDPSDSNLPAAWQPLRLCDEARSVAWGILPGSGKLRSFAFVSAEGDEADPYKEQLQKLIDMFADMVAEENRSIVFLEGGEESDRRNLAGRLAREAGMDLLVVSAKALLCMEDIPDCVLSIERKLLIEDCMLYMGDLPEDDDSLSDMAAVFMQLQQTISFFMIGGDKQCRIPAAENVHVIGMPDKQNAITAASKKSENRSRETDSGSDEKVSGPTSSPAAANGELTEQSIMEPVLLALRINDIRQRRKVMDPEPLIRIATDVVEDKTDSEDASLMAAREVLLYNIEVLVHNTGNSRVSPNVRRILECYEIYNTISIFETTDGDHSYENICGAIRSVMNECIVACDAYNNRRRGWSASVRSRSGVIGAAREQTARQLALFEKMISDDDPAIRSAIMGMAENGCSCGEIFYGMILIES